MRSRWAVRGGAVALAVVALVSIAGTGVAGAGVSDDGDGRGPRTIEVRATGLVQGTPDVLELTVGVATRGRSAVEALQRNRELAIRVIEVLRDAGVGDGDVQTSNLSVSPTHDDDGDITGYEVQNLVNAKLRDFDKAGQAIDAATGVAGNDVIVYGVHFSFDDSSELVAKARSEAVKRARAQAKQLADAADVSLGDLLSLTENSQAEPPVFEAEARDLDAATSTPIEPGSEILRVEVTLIYEID